MGRTRCQNMFIKELVCYSILQELSPFICLNLEANIYLCVCVCVILMCVCVCVSHVCGHNLKNPVGKRPKTRSSHDLFVSGLWGYTLNISMLYRVLKLTPGLIKTQKHCHLLAETTKCLQVPPGVCRRITG